MSEHERTSRTTAYLLVPLMPALLLGIAHAGAGRWLPNVESLLYWIGNWMLFWAMAFGFTRALTAQSMRSLLPRWLLIFAGGLASAVTFTLLSPWYNQFFSGSITDPDILDRLLNPRSRLEMLSLIQTATAGGAGAGLWTLATLLFESSAIQKSSPSTMPPDSPAASAALGSMGAPLPTPRFIERMPGINVEDILALEAEDHYVRVHLITGSELIHYKFADAVNEMGTEYGIRVHRSFWVAKPAIKDIKRGQRIEITITNGSRIPVSNSYRFFL